MTLIRAAFVSMLVTGLWLEPAWGLDVKPLLPGKPLATFVDDTGEKGPELDPGAIPASMKVLEESPNGKYYRVKVAGKDYWLLKRQLVSSGAIDANCTTADAGRNAALSLAATRNANEGCVRPANKSK